MRRRLAAVVLVVGAVGLASCGDEVAPAAAGNDSGAAAELESDAGERLDFTVTTVDGGTFEGASLLGKPSVLWFWAPWCPTCASQAGFVADLAEEYEGEINVVGVAGLDGQSAMERFVADYGVAELTHLADEEGTVWKRFGVTAQSTFVLLNAEGGLSYQGYLEPGELTDRVDALAG